MSRRQTIASPRLIAAALAPAMMLGACATDMEPAAETRQSQGRTIAATECAQCHAIGRNGTSPRAEAPPLRTVLAGYNTATLEMDLMEGMRIGHQDMPRFELDPQTTDALIAYLQSIQD